MGHVRGGWHCHGLRHLPPRPQATDIGSVYLPLRHPRWWKGRSASSSTCWQFSPPLRYGGIAGPRRSPDRQRHGFQRLDRREIATPVLVVIVAVLTACFVASAVSGISRGIQWLSNINMVLAVLLAVIVFVAGPTLVYPEPDPAAVGDYARDLAKWPRGPKPSATRPCASGCPAGPSSTGHGGCPGRPLLACSSPGSAAAAPSGSSSPECCWSPASSASSGSGSSAAPPSESSAGRQATPDNRRWLGQDRQRNSRPSPLTVPCSICSTTCPCPRHGHSAVAILAMVLVAIFFVTGADCGVHHDGLAQLQRVRANPPGSGHLLGCPDRRSRGGDAPRRRR